MGLYDGIQAIQFVQATKKICKMLPSAILRSL